MRKTFPCGHKGKGLYCHRCKAESEAKKKAKAEAPKNKAHLERKHMLAQAASEFGADLNKLPHTRLIQKAIQIMGRVHTGEHFCVIGGKVLKYSRKMSRRLVVFSLDMDYRLIYEEDTRTHSLRLIGVVSHEEYNARKPLENKI